MCLTLVSKKQPAYLGICRVSLGGEVSLVDYINDMNKIYFVFFSESLFYANDMPLLYALLGGMHAFH
jgi:hypothetical protein